MYDASLMSAVVRVVHNKMRYPNAKSFISFKVDNSTMIKLEFEIIESTRVDVDMSLYRGGNLRTRMIFGFWSWNPSQVALNTLNEVADFTCLDMTEVTSIHVA
jgi:hypothetical protein